MAMISDATTGAELSMEKLRRRLRIVCSACVRRVDIIAADIDPLNDAILVNVRCHNEERWIEIDGGRAYGFGCPIEWHRLRDVDSERLHHLMVEAERFIQLWAQRCDSMQRVLRSRPPDFEVPPQKASTTPSVADAIYTTVVSDLVERYTSEGVEIPIIIPPDR